MYCDKIKASLVSSVNFSFPKPVEVSNMETFIFRYRSVFSVPLFIEPGLHQVFQNNLRTNRNSNNNSSDRNNSIQTWLKKEWKRYKELNRPSNITTDTFGLSLLLNDKWLKKSNEKYFLAVMNVQFEPKPFVPEYLSDGSLFSPHPLFSLFPSNHHTDSESDKNSSSNSSSNNSSNKTQSNKKSTNSRAVCLWFRDGASSTDMVAGFLHASILRYILESESVQQRILELPSTKALISEQEESLIRSALLSSPYASSPSSTVLESHFKVLIKEMQLSKASHSIAIKLFPNVMSSLVQTGWRTKNIFLAEADARVLTVTEHLSSK